MMETTERIVESYVRYIKRWATIANIPCGGQHEIDLLCIDPLNLDRYHIEVSVHIAQGFSKLNAKPFNLEKLKQRTQQADQRRTIGFFIEHKFEPDFVLNTLENYGFEAGNFQRVIVSWGWTDEAASIACEHQITLWDFRDIVLGIAEQFRGKRTYFHDDTLRTLQLFTRAIKEMTPAD